LSVPKIDWYADGDDQPRWQPRPRRDRMQRDPRIRRASFDGIIAAAAQAPFVPNLAARRPLHLIWGTPIRTRELPGEDV
jgi:hypothetical protein